MTSKPVYFCLKKPRAPASEHAWPNLSENLCPCVCPCPQIKVPGSVMATGLFPDLSAVRSSRPLLSLPHTQCPGKWSQFAGRRKEDPALSMQLLEFSVILEACKPLPV